MVVVITESTNVRFVTYSSVSATLATAFSEVINALDTGEVKDHQIQGTSLSFDDTGQEYIYVVLVKKSP